MTQEELFTLKGKLSFQIQVAQAQLQQVDRQLIDLANGKTPEAEPNKKD